MAACPFAGITAFFRDDNEIFRSRKRISFDGCNAAGQGDLFQGRIPESRVLNDLYAFLYNHLVQ